MIQNKEICRDFNPYFLTVPMNDKGINDVDCMRDETPDLLEYVLPPEEFQKLQNAGVFKELNETYNLLIDTYESERIPFKACAGSLEILREVGVEKKSIFATALKRALNYGTFVECDF